MSFLPNKFVLYLVFAGLITLSIFNTYKAVTDIVALSKSEAEADREITRLEEEKSILQKRLESVNSEMFVEKEARTKLNMKKEGEEVYIIPTSSGSVKDQNIIDESSVLGDSTRNKDLVEASNFEKWLEILF